MASLNRIVLVGRLTGDPDAKSTVEGLPVTRFRLAVDRFQREGSPQATDFIDVVTWRKLAEVSAAHLKKGRLVLVEGRIQIRSYDDQSGQKKWVTEVVGRSIQFLDGSQAETGPMPQATGGKDIQSFTEEVADIEDDLPF
jgi:single-strand DNA-binding protein